MFLNGTKRYKDLNVLVRAIVVLVFICLAVPPVFAGTRCDSVPEAIKGNLDIKGWDFIKNGPVKLDGAWQFCWNRLIEPGSGQWNELSLPVFYPVPQFWTSYPGLNLPAKGYTTYRLIIKTAGNNKNLALQTPELFTEYKVWINGRLVGQNGIDPLCPPRFLKPDIFPFSLEKGDTIEIVLQLKNQRHANAGIAQSFVLGTEKQIYREFIIHTSLEIILISICLFAGFYHTIIFLFRPGEKELFYFGMFSLMLALRTFFTGRTLVSWVIPELPFALGSEISTATIPCCVILFQLFSHFFFKKERPNLVFWVITAVHFLYALTIPFVSTMTYSVLFKYYLGAVTVSIALILYIGIRAIVKRVAFSRIFFGGILVLFVGTLNDMMHYLQIIDTGYYLAQFFLVFILAESIMLAIKFSREHKTVAILSEKLKVFDRLKDAFLANTSHELRTPVNGIIGLADSLINGAAGPLPQKARQNLTLIVSSGKRLSALINDVLDFSKLKNNNILISKKPVDLCQVVSIVMTVIRSTTPSKTIELINDIPKDLPFVYGDENRLQQIFYNLIGNSVKYTDQGYVKVSATPVGDAMQVRVADTGIGIDPDRKNAIFNAFEQGDGSTEREYQGTGLGLSITKKLVELHGGEIRVESEPGKGACFIFTLPGTNANEKKAKGTDFKPGSPDGILLSCDVTPAGDFHDQNENKKVLIVDDEAVNGQVLLNYMGVKKLGADFVQSGHLALEKIEAGNYDLVLLDIMMPRMSGYDVCRKLRETYSSFELPIIFLTAKNQPGDLVTAFDVGANDYIVKPVDQTELFARIDTHLSLKYAAAKAIENAKLANIDPLTGLYNRRYFMKFGKREFETAKRSQTNLSVIMVDIDKFKDINDRYGHDMGDKVLRQISSTIRKNLRATDIPGRFGGDEFVTILPGTDLQGAVPVAEKILSIVREDVITLKNGRNLSLTLSLGVSAYSKEMNSFGDMLEQADKMLYISKKNGRNRVSYSVEDSELL